MTSYRNSTNLQCLQIEIDYIVFIDSIKQGNKFMLIGSE